MDSATGFTQYHPRNPKRRMLMGGGSSSAAYGKADAVEAPLPAIDRSSKPNFSAKEVYHEIIDTEMEDAFDDSSLVDTELDENPKGKDVVDKATSSNGSTELEALDEEANLSNEEDEDANLDNGDDEDADLYYGEEDWNDTYEDDFFLDDTDNLTAHFDHMDLPPGVEAPVPWLQVSSANDAKFPTASTSTNSGNSLHGVPKKVVDEIVLKFEAFAKFDSVDDYTDHHYSSRKDASKLAPKNWSKRIQEEWKILEEHLPREIYVRAYETRMDLLRAVIIGAEGTPYHDGLFFFDFYFPSSYPQIPPEVYYHSRGLRINPNLYACGKVCLSLLNTWSGSTSEKWVPGKSTILQVLVSIQGLILNAEPFYNEPGYEGQRGTKAGEASSATYNERTYMHSLKTMVYSIQRPPKHFEDFVVGYFRKNASYILVSCVACLNGAPAGNLNSDMKCSEGFRKEVGKYITFLAETFTSIGATGCQDFLAKAENKEVAAPTAALETGIKFN